MYNEAQKIKRRARRSKVSRRRRSSAGIKVVGLQNHGGCLADSQERSDGSENRGHHKVSGVNEFLLKRWVTFSIRTEGQSERTRRLVRLDLTILKSGPIVPVIALVAKVSGTRSAGISVRDGVVTKNLVDGSEPHKPGRLDSSRRSLRCPADRRHRCAFAVKEPILGRD